MTDPQPIEEIFTREHVADVFARAIKGETAVLYPDADKYTMLFSAPAPNLPMVAAGGDERLKHHQYNIGFKSAADSMVFHEVLGGILKELEYERTPRGHNTWLPTKHIALHYDAQNTILDDDSKIMMRSGQIFIRQDEAKALGHALEQIAHPQPKFLLIYDSTRPERLDTISLPANNLKLSGIPESNIERLDIRTYVPSGDITDHDLKALAQKIRGFQAIITSIPGGTATHASKEETLFFDALGKHNEEAKPPLVRMINMSSYISTHIPPCHQQHVKEVSTFKAIALADELLQELNAKPCGLSAGGSGKNVTVLPQDRQQGNARGGEN